MIFPFDCISNQWNNFPVMYIGIPSIHFVTVKRYIRYRKHDGKRYYEQDFKYGSLNKDRKLSSMVMRIWNASEMMLDVPTVRNLFVFRWELNGKRNQPLNHTQMKLDFPKDTILTYELLQWNWNRFPQTQLMYAIQSTLRITWVVYPTMDQNFKSDRKLNPHFCILIGISNWTRTLFSSLEEQTFKWTSTKR